MKQVLLILLFVMVSSFTNTAIADADPNTDSTSDDALLKIVSAPVGIAQGGVKVTADIVESGVKTMADVVEGGTQVAGAVVDQLLTMVRKRGKPSPTRRKKPQFLTDELRTLDDFAKNWWEWQHSLGDISGVRPWLDEQGLIVESAYTGEFFSNLHGGLNTNGATEYRGNFDLTVTADAERLGLGPGIVFVYAQLAHGTSISGAHVGDTQTLSNLDAPYLWQVSEYWFDQLFFDGKLRIKLGKQDSNADFVAVDYGGDFIGSSFAVIPTVPMPTFPDPALGAAAFYELTDWLSIGAGIYEGAPQGNTSGFNTAFNAKSNGTFSICEMVLKPTFVAQQELPGTYRFGGWYHNEDFEEVGDEADTDVFAGNSGSYVACDQMLYREQADNDQGLGAFIQVGWAPENRNEIDRYFGAGLSYAGLIPERDDDLAGIGVAQARFSNRMADVSKETAIELFYKAQLTEFAAIQPEFQYIANPSGNGRDALVFGVRFEVVF